MTQRNPIAPGQGAEARVAELHRLCDEDYKSAVARRGQNHRDDALLVSYSAIAAATHTPEPSDLDVAISVAQQLLDSDSVLSMREALRLLLRALHAEPVGEQPPAEPHTPIGPGCGAPATTRIEGYSSCNGLTYGSLDLAVYACAEHANQAREGWLDGLRPHTGSSVGDSRCGERFDYVTLDVPRGDGR
ncbi:hypothetical protein [Streptomyces sp. NPDC000618]|uniref:hypothetical protein n=1 Tax=Streptomyces sp. NPDC000618 TaxID=3154265 RepID=UPI0033295954